MTSSVLTGDVRQTLDHFRRSVDQFFENFYGFPAETGRAISSARDRQWMFSSARWRSAWGDSALHLRAIVPGITQENLKVTVQNNQLVIEGERKAPDGFNKNSLTQLAYGKFYTAVTLPAGLDVEKLNCPSARRRAGHSNPDVAKK